jgi:Protein of unknown function (DUF3575)
VKNYNLLLCICLSLVCSLASAQQKDSVILNTPKRFHAVKFSPLHLLSPVYPTVQLAYEFQLTKRNSIQLDVGVALPTSMDQDFQNLRGMKLKGEHRYYFYQAYKDKVRMYVASELYWNRINFDRETTKTECFDLNCQTTFRRTYFYEITYREVGTALKYGIMIVNHRFVFDFNVGLSYRDIEYAKPGLPQTGFNDDGVTTFFRIPNEDNRRAPGIMLGVRFGYQLSRN